MFGLQDQAQSVFSWVQAVLSVSVSLLLGIVVYLATNTWWIGLAVTAGAIFLQYLLLGKVLVAVGTHSKTHYVSLKISWIPRFF